MTPNEITTWLWTARTKVIETLGFAPTWWPTTQGQASTLAAAFFLTATLATVGGPKEKLSVSAAWKKNPGRRKVVERLWGVDDTALSQYEVLLDFSVHDWKKKVFLLTGESEVFAYHGVGDSVTTDDDYSWDFFKLLAVRSPMRLFLARVGTRERAVPIAKRIATLERSLRSVLDWSADRLLGPGDELGIVLLAATKEASKETRVLYFKDSALVSERAEALGTFPRMWKRKA